MLRTIRNLTQLYIFNPLPTKTPQHLRPFTTTIPKTRDQDPQFPDEEARIARYKRQAEYHRIRYQNDPLFQAHCLQKQRAHWAKNKTNETAQLNFSLNNWIRLHEWVRKDLPWKTYVPVLSERKVKHYCHGCDWMRVNGLMLWWRKKGVDEQVREDGDGEQQVKEDGDDGQVGKSDRYLCHTCYVTKRSRFEVLPEGYEDVKTFKELAARKKQLDGLAATSSATSN